MTDDAVEVFQNRSRRLVSAVIRQAIEDHCATVEKLLRTSDSSVVEMMVMDSVELLVAKRAELTRLLNEQGPIECRYEQEHAKTAAAQGKLDAYTGDSHARRGQLKYALGVCLDRKKTALNARCHMRDAVKKCAKRVAELEAMYDASAWILSEDESIGSFVWCCELANLVPRMLRDRMFRQGLVAEARQAMKSMPRDDELAHSVH